MIAKFDNYLKETDNKQKTMILFSFIVAIGFLLNQFVVPMMEQGDELRESVETLQYEVSKNSNKRLKRTLVKKKKDLLLKKEQLREQKEEVDYIISKVYKIKYAFFDEKRWAETLDEMLSFSVKRDIKVISLKSKNTDDITKYIFKQKKGININGVGRYRDVLALIQHIENFETLLEFKKIDIHLEDSKVAFDFDISVYGAGL